MYKSSRRICNSSSDKTLRQLKSHVFKSHSFQCVVEEVKKFERSVEVCNCKRKSYDSVICSPLTYPSGFSKGSSSSIIRKSEPLVVTFFFYPVALMSFYSFGALSYRVLTLMVKTYFCFHMCSKQGVYLFLVQESAKHSVQCAKRNSRPSEFCG